ncbi:MAG: hypothetical protein N2255_02080, partial [Kiritimatiellae bacterium]|nr:hypothetical protein [Kiritimatiellia bacterium]
VKSLAKEGMTDEEKVLNVFHWLRRAIWHGRGDLDVDLAYNFHYQIHIFGTGSCLRQTTPLSVLWERLGYNTRGWATGGHHCIQVFYGGKWHLFDPHMNFYVYDRGTPPSIASIEQIKEDPTLVSDAVKEGRACPGFLLCGDDVRTFATREGWKDMGPFPESEKYRPRIKEPFGGIVLRRGESYVRTWKPGKYWVLKYWPNDGPFHSCGAKDEKDSVNLPILEPHVWITPSGSRRYRHGASGFLEYTPDLTTEHYRDAIVSETNLGCGAISGTKGLVPRDPAKAAEVIFCVACPYAITAGDLQLKCVGKGAPKAEVSTNTGKTWLPLALKANEDGTFACLFVSEVNGSLNGYWLKLTIPEQTVISTMRLISHFQLNPVSLPYLVPGRNMITVEAEYFGSPLAVAWTWYEGENWGQQRSLRQTFTSRSVIEVEVAGQKYPRMDSIILSVEP